MLRNILRKEISKIVGAEIEVKISEPERAEFGDFSTNAAFALSKTPKEFAEKLAEKLSKSSKIIQRAESKNGFINIFLKDEVLLKALGERVKFPKKKEKINVEFVSANPTGPLTMANARGGFLGDVLANVLKKTGENVIREYYINDAGNQIKLLGDSVLAELNLCPKKLEHYRGKYIESYAESIRTKLQKFKKAGYTIAVVGGLTVDLEGDEFKVLEIANVKDVGEIAMRNKIDPSGAFKQSLEEIKNSLEKSKIKFDVWFSENEQLRKTGELEAILKKLKTETKDGAVWFYDWVLVKSDGEFTYFLADLAYHHDKFFKRKFSLAIDVWGADHAGHVERLKKGVEALEINLAKLKIIIVQMVRLVSSGKEVRMSKRTGEFVTMDELLEEVGLDAARWFFLARAPETHMDFDLDLAIEKSDKNPVYYVQYAHTRMASILVKSKGKSQKVKVFSHQSERALAVKILRYPELLEDISRDYQVHRLTTYAYELAQTFSAFYRDVKVIGSEREAELLYLVSKAKETLADLLKLMGISQPEQM
ncbi:MAG: arginine--tRNA ligase [bacterium]|nr:arginine--tRNA ligase [bacterium]